MSKAAIRIAAYQEKPSVPNYLDGLRKALEAALDRIDDLEDEVRRLRGEAPLREETGDT